MAPVESHGMTRVIDLHRTCGRYAGISAGRSDVPAGCRQSIPDIQSVLSARVSVAGRCENGRVVAAAHRPAPSGRPRRVHNFNACTDTCTDESRQTSLLDPAAAQLLLVAGEIGESTSSHGVTGQVMKWFGDRSPSYPGWRGNTRAPLLRPVPGLEPRR
ncbi:hypothetical protein [Streptomyces sp. NPDC008137]|uniref:hypothetical protein n=1 Tax=Streptomyces sp. NPDC008137 TaxID=3364813 RepID=UPI0036E881C5